MPRLSLSQIQTVLAAAAETCALSIDQGEVPFFKQMEWWLADGVFNQEPHGMFRTQAPYQKGDLRSVAEFLAQEPFHRWEGLHTLRDLFCSRVIELLSSWCQERLKDQLGADAPGEDEWEHVYQAEWEDALYLADLNPNAPVSIWDEFLELPLSTLVENWRDHAQDVAQDRRLKAARMLSRQDLEQSMILRVSGALERLRQGHAHPHDTALLLDETCAVLGEWGPTEVAIYVHSSLFSQNTEAALLNRLYALYPIPESWQNEKGLVAS